VTDTQVLCERLLLVGYLGKDTSQKVENMKKSEKELAEEIDLLDTMLSSLVELLEEKGVLTQQEWEKRIKERVVIE